MKNNVLQIIAIALIFLANMAFAGVEFTAPSKRTVLNIDKAWPKNHFLALCYHDVEDESADERYLSVRTSALNDQIAWLYDNGYQAVNLKQILDAHNGVADLPEKAVLLSFDDGYSSFYTRVYPLLKAYNWPALWSPVGKWLDAGSDETIDFGGLPTKRERFATWDMIREMKDSPLVDVGAHTWDSHFGGLANSLGSSLPVVANRLYSSESKAYETDIEFQERIQIDVSKITNKIAETSGKSPVAWVWPYGEANGTTLSIVKDYGYKMAFTLEPGLANVKNLDSMPRMLISGNPSIEDFARQITQFEERPPVRVMHVDLDYVYDTDAQQQSKNIDALIQRVFDMKISHVFLQAYADPKGDGTVKELYFPNRWLPVRADLFNYLSWQLHNRTDVQVYAWMPVLSFAFDDTLPKVQANQGAKGLEVDTEQYQRLSPWNPEVRQRIKDIYEDLARHSVFHGILFHDDALLSDFEDASPDALAAYEVAGFGSDIDAIRRSPEQLQAWTRYKSRFLIDFTEELTSAVRSIRGPHVKTARNIYALPVLEPASEEWFAQNFNDFVQAYDWTAIMAMPLMEGVPLRKSSSWLKNLVKTAYANEEAKDKVLFELQTLNWNKKGQHVPLPSKILAEWMYELQINGVRHFGYYPDDFLVNHPDMKVIRPAFSSYWYPNND